MHPQALPRFTLPTSTSCSLAASRPNGINDSIPITFYLENITPQAAAPLLGVGLPCLVMGALAECTNIWYRRRPMGRNTSITLGPHFDEFIAAQVENGRYGSASEVVRAGLRLLEETESKLERLRRLLDEGEQSGIADYSLESVIAELDNEAH